jgi:hypothetical protein
MYWLELSGHNFQGELGVERISTPFQTIDEAVSKAKKLAENPTSMPSMAIWALGLAQNSAPGRARSKPLADLRC